MLALALHVRLFKHAVLGRQRENAFGKLGVVLLQVTDHIGLLLQDLVHVILVSVNE